MTNPKIFFCFGNEPCHRVKIEVTKILVTFDLLRTERPESPKKKIPPKNKMFFFGNKNGAQTKYPKDRRKGEHNCATIRSHLKQQAIWKKKHWKARGV